MNTDREQQAKQSRWGFRGMTVRDWLELLIVPMVLVGIGLLFEMQQADRQQATETQQQQLAEQRAQDEALQAYLDQMSGLLLERDLRASEEDSEVRTLARARTLTVLGRLDPSGKTALMQFLVEADLGQRVEDGRDPIISLRGADLSDADLFNADLRGANLSNAFLSNADLRDADLSKANLLDADLSDATLRHADLSEADLIGAEGITNAELEQQFASLEGATMPNGQKYEDWLKDKDDRKDEG
jgi:uncharacterized protein YjbI with pentapeptide repeats